jgi:hypothetical protein
LVGDGSPWWPLAPWLIRFISSFFFMFWNVLACHAGWCARHSPRSIWRNFS